jgi:hypothetical protein
MKRATKITVILSAALALVLAGSLAFAHRPGRDLIGSGELTELEGTLSSIGSAWTLETAGGAYLLHLGNPFYLEELGVELADGERITVQGYLDGEDLVAARIDLGGESYRLRDDEGYPLWAGWGFRRAEGPVCHGPGAFTRFGRAWGDGYRRDAPGMRGDGYRWQK